MRKNSLNAGEFQRQTIYSDFVACFTTRESQTEKPADAQKLLTQASVAEELERPSHESTKTLLTVAAIGSAIIYYLWR